MTLNYLDIGRSATIKTIVGEDAVKARMGGFGLCAGRTVTVVRRARLGGPLQVRVGYTDVLMRPQQADLIHLS